MNIKPINTEQDYDAALYRLNEIFDAPLQTPEGEELQVLAVLIEAYEEKIHPIDAPDPIEAIRIRMKEMNFQQKDLVGVIGGKSRVSEVLNRKKRLTVDMIRVLAKVLNLPAELLVLEYELK